MLSANDKQNAGKQVDGQGGQIVDCQERPLLNNDERLLLVSLLLPELECSASFGSRTVSLDLTGVAASVSLESVEVA